tara:strand:+ start:192 stop:407 length:216 start_codon:yes stop_codon:yes gene_type:complete
LVEELKSEDYARFFNMINHYQTFDDWPWLLYYKELDKRYPEAKFILTVRDEISWVKSYQNMLNNQSRPLRK